MIEIIKPGEIKKYTMVCPDCGCEFTYEKSDLESEYADKLNTDLPSNYFSSYVYIYYIKCPCCGKKLVHSYEAQNATNITPKPIQIYYSDSPPYKLACDKCPNKPDPNKVVIGDTPCTWCKKNQITCTNSH